MILLIFFALLAGIVTILSPCILPILPLILSGSLTGSKKRPIGIVIGFILSFTFFTLFLTAIVKATGISANALRNISVVIIAVFGLALILPKFQTVVERLFSKLSSIVPQRNQDASNPDIIAGFFIGISLGLIWTPCVGPILAAIITLAATSTITANAVLITLGYSVGTAIPLLAITYGGRQFLDKVPWLTKNTPTIQKAFGVLMILTALAIYTQADRKFQSYILSKFPNYGAGLTKFEDIPAVRAALEKLKIGKTRERERGKPMFEFLLTEQGQAPDFIPGGQWLNSKPLTIEELRGKVVLVDFWTYTCINCIRTLPYLTSWWNKYKDQGLVIVGVHTPEFEFEKDLNNLAGAVRDFGLTYPIMQDNNYATWEAYANRYWPAKYLIDKNGNIRYTHFGEGKYDETEQAIRALLSETGSDITGTKVDNPAYTVYSKTPELYLGYWRIGNFVSPEPIVRDSLAVYSVPATVPRNSFAFAGSWTVGYQRAMPEKGSSLVLRFDAAEVFLVMRPKNGNGFVRVFLDGVNVTNQAGIDVKNGVVTVNSDRLYKLIKVQTPGEHLLKLEFLDSNVELYAFTFG